MHPSRRRLLLLSGRPWTPAQLPGLMFWHDASKLVLNNLDPVTTWFDLSGNGRDQAQGTAAAKPTYQVNQINGLPAVVFDGIDDFMKAVAFIWNQPEYIFTVIRIVAAAAGDSFWDGNALNVMRSYQSSAGIIRLFAGGAGPTSGALGTTWHVISSLYNGAGSLLQIDNAAVITGNVGVGNAGGLKLGVRGDEGAEFGNIAIAEIFGSNIAVDPSIATNAMQYLSKKYGIAV